MFNRTVALRWSVVTAGCVLLGLVAADWSTATGTTAVNAVKRALPTVLAAGIICVGVWLRRRDVSDRDIGLVALGTVAGGVLFTVIDVWLSFVVSLGAPELSVLTHPTLNLVGIGAAGNGLLTALYLQLRNQNRELEQLTEQLEERNARLAQQTAKLRTQNERLNQFASIVSHDLRNPLNVAAGRLELARETGDDDHFEAVEQAHDRMETLVTETLALARHGETVEESEDVELRSIAESAWQSVPTDGVTLDVVEDASFEADGNRLQQMFENLFRNAVEHGGSTSTVRVGVLDCEGFYVEDDGDGLPENADDLFEFGHSTASDGTGFGLAVVNAIVEAHGWCIDATGSVDGGARFEVRTAVAEEFDDRAVAAN